MNCNRCKILDDLYANKILLDALKEQEGTEVEQDFVYVRLETLLKAWDNVIKTP